MIPWSVGLGGLAETSLDHTCFVASLLVLTLALSVTIQMMFERVSQLKLKRSGTALITTLCLFLQVFYLLPEALQKEEVFGSQGRTPTEVFIPSPHMAETGHTKIVAASSGEMSYDKLAILWYHRMTKLGYTTHELLALDDVAALAFERHGLRYSSLRLCLSRENSQKRYRLHLFAVRWFYVQEQLRQGYNVLLTDVDNFFARYKPMSDMEQLQDIDVVHAYSGNHPPNMVKAKGWSVCGGMIWIRASPGGLNMVDSLIQGCGLQHGDRCTLSCEDQRKINNNYLHNEMNFTFEMEGKNAEDIDAGSMAQLFWKPPITGRSSFYNFTIWDVDTAYRGPALPPNGTCPKNNWVAMPYAWKDRLTALRTFRKECDPSFEEISGELNALELKLQSSSSNNSSG